MTETTTPEDVEGNARLIAAAPDLLAACVALLGMIDDAQSGKRHPNPVEVYSQASEAISKATNL